jgi:MobA/VirD2-like, nuclease domain
VIATIHKGADFGHAAGYPFGPGERGGHVDPRVLGGDQVLLGGPRSRDWVADMAFCARLRPEVVRPVWHCSLRAAPRDPVLDDTVWAAIGRRHVAAMGLGEHPWVVLRHGVGHVHVVAGRVNAYGEVWHDRNDYVRARASVRVIEREYGLAVVDVRHQSARSGRAPGVGAESPG